MCAILIKFIWRQIIKLKLILLNHETYTGNNAFEIRFYSALTRGTGLRRLHTHTACHVTRLTKYASLSRHEIYRKRFKMNIYFMDN